MMRCYLFFLTYALDSEAQWRQSASHTHTHICPPNTACCTVNSQPTLSHYTWKLTIIPYMAFPASQYLLPFFPLVARGSDFFLSQSPPPVPLNHCFLVNYAVMLLFIESAVRCCADPPTRDHAGKLTAQCPEIASIP